MIDGGPLHGGASAEFVINKESTFLPYIKDRLETVIGVASYVPGSTELKFQLVNTKHWLASELLRNVHSFECAFLPLFIVKRKNNPSADTSPKPVG